MKTKRGCSAHVRAKPSEPVLIVDTISLFTESLRLQVG